MAACQSLEGSLAQRKSLDRKSSELIVTVVTTTRIYYLSLPTSPPQFHLA